MKKALLLVVGLSMVFTASLAFAQAGNVVIWSDPGPMHSSCETVGTGTIFWYLTFEGHNGFKAIQFKVDAHGNFIHIADSWATILAIGDASQGVALSFTSCMTGSVELGSTIWSGLGTAAACSTVDVVPDPTAPSGQIEGADCTDAKIFPGGSFLTVNPNGTCTCGIVVPVEETNWGQIKALYNN